MHCKPEKPTSQENKSIKHMFHESFHSSGNKKQHWFSLLIQCVGVASTIAKLVGYTLVKCYTLLTNRTEKSTPFPYSPMFRRGDEYIKYCLSDPLMNHAVCGGSQKAITEIIIIFPEASLVMQYNLNDVIRNLCFHICF